MPHEFESNCCMIRAIPKNTVIFDVFFTYKNYISILVGDEVLLIEFDSEKIQTRLDTVINPHYAGPKDAKKVGYSKKLC